jgi:acetate kinase
MKILVLNSGSSSQKSCLYDIGNTLPAHPPAPTWEGKIEWNGDHADIQAQNSQGAQLKDRMPSNAYWILYGVESCAYFLRLPKSTQ